MLIHIIDIRFKKKKEKENLNKIESYQIWVKVLSNKQYSIGSQGIHIKSLFVLQQKHENTCSNAKIPISEAHYKKGASPLL